MQLLRKLRCQSELPADRGLYACPIEDFAFDFRYRNRLGAHRLDRDLGSVIGVEMLHGANEYD